MNIPSLPQMCAKTPNPNSKLLDHLKFTYRPYICPCDDLLNLIPPNACVMDIGFGSGQFLFLAARFSPAARLSGIEISPRLVENARQLFAAAEVELPYDFQTYDGVRFPEGVETADVLFLIDVLHHVPKALQEHFLSALHRAMRPGALLVFKDIDAASLLVYCNKLHDLILSRQLGHELSSTAARELAENIGFSVQAATRRRMLWYPHYTLVLVKN